MTGRSRDPTQLSSDIDGRSHQFQNPAFNQFSTEIDQYSDQSQDPVISWLSTNIDECSDQTQNPVLYQLKTDHSQSQLNSDQMHDWIDLRNAVSQHISVTSSEIAQSLRPCRFTTQRVNHAVREWTAQTHRYSQVFLLSDY